MPYLRTSRIELIKYVIPHRSPSAGARREPALAMVTDGSDASVRLATVPRRLTNTEARRITGSGRDGALASLRRLRDRGFITQHGSRGGACYLLDRGLILGGHDLPPQVRGVGPLRRSCDGPRGVAFTT